MAGLSRRTSATTARRDEVEASLLASTERLLEQGISYADLSVEQIATEAGIKRTAFYFYFRDKRELMMRLTEEIAELLYTQAETWWSGEGEGRDELPAALHGVVKLYGDHGVLLRAVVEASAYDETVGHFWRALTARFTEATRARIASEQASGRALDLDPQTTAFALTWMIERTVYQWLVEGRDVADAAFLESLCAIWLRSIYGAA